MTFLNEKDKKFIAQKGISEQIIEKQIGQFKKGFPFVQLESPATPENGILVFNETMLAELISFFDNNKSDYSILKFVPASGAASRMFKHLFEFVQQYKNKPIPEGFVDAGASFGTIAHFFEQLKNFAFYDDLNAEFLKFGTTVEQKMKDGALVEIVEKLLYEDGLNYGNQPKALLKFHHYEDGNRFALEEHLVEAAVYSTDKNKTSKVHFTISPEHRERFEAVMKVVISKYEQQFGVNFQIQFSEQKPSTDTIAVDLENNPFRNEDDSLLFRPGGHGALIENLNDLEEEIIFIKNIDNVVPDSLRDETYRYKKAIGGLLLDLQQKTFDYLDLLDSGNLNTDELDEIRSFAESRLMINISTAFDGYSEIEKVDYLFERLNRPMRICGMVRNEGEPGGGPYWVQNNEGILSLQIVESSQMDLKNPKQLKHVKNATHFNPVDLVCGTYDFRGKKFHLPDFVDPETGFISEKSKDGKSLKALELPGLWNGAMADWITVFVETPIITFNPVKTVNDLLRPQHQSK